MVPKTLSAKAQGKQKASDEGGDRVEITIPDVPPPRKVDHPAEAIDILTGLAVPTTRTRRKRKEKSTSSLKSKTTKKDKGKEIIEKPELSTSANGKEREVLGEDDMEDMYMDTE